jgi:F0F1-type ATP synthase assembly protein I
MERGNYEDESLNSEYKRLTRDEVQALFTENQLAPKVTSPWQIVKVQSFLTFAFTIIAVIYSLIFDESHLALSVLLGGVLGVFPSVVFIIRIQVVKKSLNAKKFISSWMYAEVIKITLTLTIIMFVIKFVPNLNWLFFLGMYIVTLQSYWLIGFLKKNK